MVTDGDGSLLAGKYYNDFLSANLDPSVKMQEQSLEIRNRTAELRAAFERQIHSKTLGISARPDAAEVISVAGKTAVFCGGSNSNVVGPGVDADMMGDGGMNGDVRVVLVGPKGESELMLAHFCESMYEALSKLMNGATDREMVLNNLELVLLLIDEHCDGGIVLETDPHKLVSSVVLRDDDVTDNESQNAGASGGGPSNIMNPTGELTMAQAFRQARDQFITGLGQRDGM